VNLWLEQQNVWCSLAAYHCPLDLYVNRKCQIGVQAQAPRGGAHAQCPIAGDANAWDRQTVRSTDRLTHRWGVMHNVASYGRATWESRQWIQHKQMTSFRFSFTDNKCPWFSAAKRNIFQVGFGIFHGILYNDIYLCKLKGEFNLDIMSQSGYWSYMSVNNFHPPVVAFCTLVKKLWDF